MKTSSRRHHDSMKSCPFSDKNLGECGGRCADQVVAGGGTGKKHLVIDRIRISISGAEQGDGHGAVRNGRAAKLITRRRRRRWYTR